MNAKTLLTLLLGVGFLASLTGCSNSDEAGTANLQSLEVSSGTLEPEFDRKTTQYTVYVKDEIATLEVFARPEHSKSTVVIEDGEEHEGVTSSAVAIDDGNDIITITVTAQNGVTSQNYFLTVVRDDVLAEGNPDTPPADDDSDTPTSVWQQTQRLKASNILNNANYGQSIAKNGSILVIGAPKENNAKGAVYIYQKQNGSWTVAQKIAPNALKEDSRFGQSLAISGSLLAIGAPRSEKNINNQGHVYTYRLQGNRFSRVSRLASPGPFSSEQFGSSVALDDSTLAVGSIQSADNNYQGGKVYVYQLSGNNWNLQSQLGNAGEGSHDFFAQSIALQGNTLATGSFDPDNQCSQPSQDKGSVRVYQRNGDQWQQSQTITANDGDPGDRFGYSVSLDGQQMVIGAQCEDGISNNNTSQGAAYVFAQQNGQWVQQQKLSASNGTAHSLFGDKAIISGDRVFVGASYESSAGLNAAGAAYVFTKGSNGQWQESQILRASNLGQNDRFGWSMAYSDNLLAIGAPQEDSGSVTFESDNSHSNSGSVYLFE